MDTTFSLDSENTIHDPILTGDNIEDESPIEEEINKKDNTLVPWIESTRPEKIEDILSHEKIKKILTNYVKTKKFPHLLFYGPPGTGKTSAAKALAKEFYGKYSDLMVLEINASEDRGIDVVRNKIHGFVLSTPNFYENMSGQFKMVILDEADSMTSEAQAMLRHVIEAYTPNARFCLICNFKNKIIDAIQSRCTISKFNPLRDSDMKDKVIEISKKHNINITSGGINMLLKIANGDMRRLLNSLQSTSMQDEKIDQEFLSDCLGYPSDKNMKYILETLKGKSLEKNISKLNQYIKSSGVSLRNILSELNDDIYNKVIKKKITSQSSNNILKGLSDMEINLCMSPSVYLQIKTLASIYFIELN
jgi:replication factor C subunit 3/5